MASHMCASSIRRASLQVSRSSAYICLRCRHHQWYSVKKAASITAKTSSAKRYASSSSNDDNLRKLLWKKDTPPGPDSSSRAPNNFERTQQRKRVKGHTKANRAPRKQPPEPVVSKAAEKDKDEQEYEREDDEEEEDEPRIVDETYDNSNNVPTRTWKGMQLIGTPDWGITEWDERHPYKNGFDCHVI